MKSLFLLTVLVQGTNSFAFEANLKGSETLTTKEIVESGATSVSCKDSKPTCVLQGDVYGIHYAGQEFKDIVWIEKPLGSTTREALKQLKADGFCN